MAYSIQLGEDDLHLVYYADPGGIISAYTAEGSAADVKDAIPQLQVMTGHTGEWNTARISGHVKRNKTRGPRAG